MLTCEYAGSPFGEPRSHPWAGALSSPGCAYYDLTAEPGHIRTSLEDFLPFGQHAAIEDFYLLLAGLNEPRSVLESNDCAFNGPGPNENPAFDRALECSGRVMVLFRDLARNTAPGQIEGLAIRLHRQLAGLDRELSWGVVGTTLVPVRYLALAEREQLGSQLMISFWAWGDTEAETLLSLQRVFGNLAQALGAVCAQLASRDA